MGEIRPENARSSFPADIRGMGPGSPWDRGRVARRSHEDRAMLLQLLKAARRLRLRYFGDVPDPSWRAQTPILKFTGAPAAPPRAPRRRSGGPKVSP
jgi:hypothetical protein